MEFPVIEYRRCWECDRKIHKNGDKWHEIDERGIWIGCEGYEHTEEEARIIRERGLYGQGV